MSEEWLSAAESAALAGRSPDAWRQLVRRTEILRATRRRRDGRTWEYPRSVVATFAPAAGQPTKD